MNKAELSRTMVGLGDPAFREMGRRTELRFHRMKIASCVGRATLRILEDAL
jgi:hypothetical protein